MIVIVLFEENLSGATLVSLHDSLNRLTNTAYSDGSREAYAYDAAGNRLSRITFPATTNVDAVPPSIATNVVSPSISSNQVVLFWNRSFDTGGSGMAGYRVYVNGTLTGSATGTNFLLTGLLPETTYCVSIAAYDKSSNESSPSPEVCFTTLGTLPPINTATQVVLFADDFNDDSINPRMWTNWLYTVTEANQVMNVDTTETDQGGILLSQPFAIDRENLVTFTRRVFLHRYQWNPTVYMAGFAISIGDAPSFGVKYCDINWGGTISGTTYLQRHGIYLYRGGANPHIQSSSGGVSDPVPIIWDTWFDEKITYSPAVGLMSYYTNGVLALEYNVGAVPNTNAFFTVTMQFNAWGWWTDHQQHMDNLSVSQKVANWWLADLTALGFSDQTFQLGFGTEPGRQYLLEGSDDLSPPLIWTPVNYSPILGTGLRTNLTDSNPLTSSHRFYRLRKW